MQLTLNGQKCSFTPIQTFREKWYLPRSFALDTFEPKDWTVGSMEGAGRELVGMRQTLVDAVPAQLTWVELPELAIRLADRFREQMEAINPQINLQQVEIDFAAAGFRDIIDAAVYTLLRLKQLHRNDLDKIRSGFDFSTIYQTWLDDSARISTTPHTFQRDNTQFTVRTVYNVYGRVGLEVQTPSGVEYVVDWALACPAAGYMYDLCRDVTAAMVRALSRPAS